MTPEPATPDRGHKPVQGRLSDGRPDVHSDSFLSSLMRRQLRLSVACTASFLIGLLALPLANYFLPELMGTRVLGFTLSWLILGVCFFPAVWIIAYVFIRRSIALEETEVREVQQGLAGFDRGGRSGSGGGSNGGSR